MTEVMGCWGGSYFCLPYSGWSPFFDAARI
jgi:hypothetical protein